ncbi:hypothetical protein AMTRI_Chr07g28490 [Amborella trichopoda]
MCRPTHNGKYLISFPANSFPRDFSNSKLHFKGALLSLEKWNRSLDAVQNKKFWVNFEGIPLHLWTNSVFRSLGNCCDLFISVHWKSVGSLPLVNLVLLVAAHFEDNFSTTIFLHMASLTLSLFRSRARIAMNVLA